MNRLALVLAAAALALSATGCGEGSSPGAAGASVAPASSQVEEAVEGLLEEGIAAIGMGIPSTIDQRRGEAVDSVNIPLSDVPLRDRLGARFGLPVAIENDANAAALAEYHRGAGRGSRHMVMLTLGTGVGGGLILDGNLYRGAIGAAAELGHITLDLHGPHCQGRCPGRGHLEVLASGTAADGYAREAAQQNPEGDLGRAAAEGKTVDARLAVELAAHGPGDARDVLSHVGFHLGGKLRNPGFENLAQRRLRRARGHSCSYSIPYGISIRQNRNRHRWYAWNRTRDRRVTPPRRRVRRYLWTHAGIYRPRRRCNETPRQRLRIPRRYLRCPSGGRVFPGR